MPERRSMCRTATSFPARSQSNDVPSAPTFSPAVETYILGCSCRSIAAVTPKCYRELPLASTPEVDSAGAPVAEHQRQRVSTLKIEMQHRAWSG